MQATIKFKLFSPEIKKKSIMDLSNSPGTFIPDWLQQNTDYIHRVILAVPGVSFICKMH